MATIKDVAKKAGVAISTASYSLNGNYDKVSKETADRVIEVAKSLNYRPNALARGLVKKKTDTIGIFLLHIDKNHPYVMEVLLEIMNIARYHGYDIVLFSNKEADDISYIDKCRERGVDGVFIIGLKDDDPYLEDIKNSDIPVVLIDKPLLGKHTTYVSSYNKRWAYKVVNYLFDRGHEKILFMNCERNSTVIQERLKGYIAAFKDKSILYSDEWILQGENKRNSAYKNMIETIKKGRDFSAVFAATDKMAIGVIDALHESGLKVPDEVSVIGFDDIELSSNIFPKLTTVRQKKSEIGKEVMEKLLKMIDGKRNLEPTLLDCELVIRDSVATRLKD